MASPKLAIKPSMGGSGNLYLIVILLMDLESIHIHHPPFLFGMSTIGAKNGLKISLTKILSNNFGN